MDPTIEQWKEISNVAKDNNLLCFFDCAYQGFASGDARKDAAAVRMFVEDGHNIALVQSFSKNFGLYGQRIGALSVVADTPEEAKRMFAYSGMSKEEVVALREKHHIYCTLDGRISMAGVTSKNVDYIAESIFAVTEGKMKVMTKDVTFRAIQT
eukprot:scaffold107881_cov78-Cyclotella_meneghiniana.AAC.2